MTWVATGYRFRAIADPDALRAEVEDACDRAALRGSVLIAPEGVNVALAGERCDLQSVLGECFADMDAKWSQAAPGNRVFRRLKVRVKDEILGFDAPLAPDAPVARRLGAAEWNELLADPDVLVLDTRNEYETRIGTFPGAVPAATATFREFKTFAGEALDAQRDKPIAMFCTGGLRCEKASAYLLEQGFRDVRQLDGGILKYWTNVDAEADAFKGECFVFDERVSVGADLNQGGYSPCGACGWPVPLAEGLRPIFCRTCRPGLFSSP